MADPAEDICDALVTLLNSAQAEDTDVFGLAFEAEKPSDPNAELDKPNDAVRVLLWPHGETEAKIGRGGQVLETFEVAMLAIRKLSPEWTRERLNGFVRGVKQYVRGRRMAGYTYSTSETTKTDLALLHENQLLVVSTILSYRGTA